MPSGQCRRWPSEEMGYDVAAFALPMLMLTCQPLTALACFRLLAWCSVHAWLLRLRTGSDLSPERLPAPAPLLHVSASVRMGRCGRCPPGSGVMSDLFFFLNVVMCLCCQAYIDSTWYRASAAIQASSYKRVEGRRHGVENKRADLHEHPHATSEPSLLAYTHACAQRHCITNTATNNAPCSCPITASTVALQSLHHNAIPAHAR